MRVIAVCAVLLVAACAPQARSSADDTQIVERDSPAAESAKIPAPGNAATPITANQFVEEDYLGRWRGVEGMYLVVAKADVPGQFRLEMQWDLDRRAIFIADATDEPATAGLSFTRDGEELLLRRTDGDATGLKYLAGKRECLTVRPGEGYCRG
ncbi:MAG: hypothetical protein JWN21_1828 [Sphingomonas bacterium]|uniref:hypothetical protein n=1 Tax=Sphingomonas bacterium TaxID=1895847 RepID=UPI002636A64C|nr:hypothetical protein [Sphingomonas bacterium]MDB5696285.1 hypothetical protein [Sphingomonas bacterium]